MKHPNKDFIAEAIADYEAMSQSQRGKLLISILEDQPYLMGFVTNLADDFSDSAHESLVDSVVILINAFISAGIPINTIPQAIINEVITEKLDTYEKKSAPEGGPDSPMVFQDLRNRAVFKSDLAEAGSIERQNFNLSLDTLISIIERSASVEIDKTGEDQ